MSQGDVQDMTVGIYQRLGPDEVRRDRFAASNKWAKRFRRDYRFSLRYPYKARRNKVDNRQVGLFIQNLRKTIREYHPKNILNMDESCIYIVAESKYTFCDVGAEEVLGGLNGDEKNCFTAMVTIAYNGQVLPTCFIAKGTSEACHSQFGEEYSFSFNDQFFH